MQSRPWQPLPRERLPPAQRRDFFEHLQASVCRRSLAMESALQLIKSANAMTPQACKRDERNELNKITLIHCLARLKKSAAWENCPRLRQLA